MSLNLLCDFFHEKSSFMKRFTMHPALPQFSKRKVFSAFGLILGLALVELSLTATPASACFHWQSCAQERGQASGTRAGGKRTGLIRGGNDAAVPYVISPRSTWISEQALPDTIRWNPVADSGSYTVRIWQWTYERNAPAEILWETTVNAAVDGIANGATDEAANRATEVTFPELPSEASLRLGRYYSVEVITADGVSSNLDEGYYQAGFQLLSAEDYDILRSRVDQISQTEAPSPEEVVLAQASTYYLDEMYADALRLLEPLAADANATHLVYTALGDVYSATGLNQLSVEAYEQALAIARAESRLSSEAIILVNLSDVHIRRGEFEIARALLQSAHQIYSELGAQPEVASLNQRLELFSPLDN